MRSLADDDETVAVDLKKGASSAQPAWMRALRDSCSEWLAVLPKVSLDCFFFGSGFRADQVAFLSQAAPLLAGRDGSNKSPLRRFFEREVSLAQKLVPTVRTDLENLVKVCDGELKQTNDLRALLSDLTKGTVPASWRRYRCRSLPVSAWIADLSKRVAQLETIVDAAEGDLARTPVSLGLLFQPQGFITASRQATAHATGKSLEQLSLRVELEKTGSSNSFTIEGMLLVIRVSLKKLTHFSENLRPRPRRCQVGIVSTRDQRWRERSTLCVLPRVDDPFKGWFRLD